MDLMELQNFGYLKLKIIAFRARLDRKEEELIEYNNQLFEWYRDSVWSDLHKLSQELARSFSYNPNASTAEQCEEFIN